jgi:hypothetical protein
MRRMKDETISNFSRRFASLYYKLSKEVQPPKVADMLHYVTTFQSDLYFLLMERNSMSLQQMFNNAQEVEENLQACQRPQNHNLKSVANTENDGVVEEHEIVHKQEVDLHLDLCHHEKETDCFMYALVEIHKCEFVDQPAKEQATASIFLFDDITEIFGKPRYDEYNYNYEVEFSKQAIALSKSENDCFQQSKEINKCAYDNSEENEESFELGERTLPLCFASFKLLKKNVYNVSN